MLVIDASAVIEVLIGSAAGVRWRDKTMSMQLSLFAPHLIDIEVLNGLRRLALAQPSLALQAERAAADFADLPIERYGHAVLLPRIWELRQNISAYDATYIALAEILDLPLLTSDGKLSRSQGHRAKIDLLS